MINHKSNQSFEDDSETNNKKKKEYSLDEQIKKQLDQNRTISKALEKLLKSFSEKDDKKESN